MSNTTTRNEFVNRAINALKPEDINTAMLILQLLAVKSYDNMSSKKGETYRHKIDSIVSDIVHIKELV